MVCSFCNFLNLLWDPVLKHIENLTTNPSLRRTKGLEMNMKAIQLDMVGVVGEPEELLVMDEWIEFLKETLLEVGRGRGAHSHGP